MSIVSCLNDFLITTTCVIIKLSYNLVAHDRLDLEFRVSICSKRCHTHTLDACWYSIAEFGQSKVFLNSLLTCIRILRYGSWQNHQVMTVTWCRCFRSPTVKQALAHEQYLNFYNSGRSVSSFVIHEIVFLICQTLTIPRRQLTSREVCWQHLPWRAEQTPASDHRVHNANASSKFRFQIF